MALRNQKGDTIIEVLLAMTLLTLILFTSWGLVNRSTQISLAARERVVMVNQVKEQAEILKTKYASVDGKLDDLISSINSDIPGDLTTSSTDYQDEFCTESVTSTGRVGSFHFTPSAKADIPSKKISPSEWVWIEYVPGTGYTDFYIRACWLTAGGQQKADNTQLIVRLNE